MLGNFWLVALFSAALAAFEVLYAGVHPFSAAGLASVCFLGYFALNALKKAGIHFPNSEYAIIACSFIGIFLAGLSKGFALLPSAMVLPFAFSAASLISLALGFASKLSG
jgi:hypothetical protein